LDNTGHAWSWGYNGNGQLGNGTHTDSSVPVPVTMPPGVTFTAIAAHFYHTIALDGNGNAWAWGYNADGELGDGTTSDKSLPVPVVMPAGIKFAIIATGGGGHSLALDTNGQAWAWGYNGNGELGNGTTSNSSVPVAVAMPPLTSFVAIAAGGNHNPSLVAPGQDHSLAVDGNGHIWAWGANSYGQLGNELAAGSTTPVLVAMPLNVTFTRVAGGGGPHSLALDSAGNAWAWGNGYFGELGDGHSGSTANTSTPTAVTMPSGVSFTGITGGGGHSVALDANGTVWSWGENTSGEVGNGSADNTDQPVQVSNLRHVVSIAAGVNHSLALAPSPVRLTVAASRAVHGGAGSFDIDLLNGSAIECRSGGTAGNYTIVFTFANVLTSVDAAAVTNGNGSVSSSSVDPNDARNYTVNLTGVSNAQSITVTLTNVTDAVGNFSGSVSASMRVLVGDTNGDGFVNSADIGQTKSQSGQSVTSSNFREDVNADGFINSADIGLVKSRSGTALP
jgi:alpha-tubulin suppressor-like RCC1 family protein